MVWASAAFWSIADYRCGHSVALNADCWPDEVRLSDIEPRFVWAASGKRGAEVRPDSTGASRRSCDGVSKHEMSKGWGRPDRSIPSTGASARRNFLARRESYRRNRSGFAFGSTDG